MSTFPIITVTFAEESLSLPAGLVSRLPKDDASFLDMQFKGEVGFIPIDYVNVNLEAGTYSPAPPQYGTLLSVNSYIIQSKRNLDYLEEHVETPNRNILIEIENSNLERLNSSKDQLLTKIDLHIEEVGRESNAYTVGYSPYAEILNKELLDESTRLELSIYHLGYKKFLEAVHTELSQWGLDETIGAIMDRDYYRVPLGSSTVPTVCHFEGIEPYLKNMTFEERHKFSKWLREFQTYLIHNEATLPNAEELRKDPSLRLNCKESYLLKGTDTVLTRQVNSENGEIQETTSVKRIMLNAFEEVYKNYLEPAQNLSDLMLVPDSPLARMVEMLLIEATSVPPADSQPMIQPEGLVDCYRIIPRLEQENQIEAFIMTLRDLFPSHNFFPTAMKGQTLPLHLESIVKEPRAVEASKVEYTLPARSHFRYQPDIEDARVFTFIPRIPKEKTDKLRVPVSSNPNDQEKELIKSAYLPTRRLFSSASHFMKSFLTSEEVPKYMVTDALSEFRTEVIRPFVQIHLDSPDPLSYRTVMLKLRTLDSLLKEAVLNSESFRKLEPEPELIEDFKLIFGNAVQKDSIFTLFASLNVDFPLKDELTDTSSTQLKSHIVKYIQFYKEMSKFLESSLEYAYNLALGLSSDNLFDQELQNEIKTDLADKIKEFLLHLPDDSHKYELIKSISNFSVRTATQNTQDAVEVLSEELMTIFRSHGFGFDGTSGSTIETLVTSLKSGNLISQIIELKEMCRPFIVIGIEHFYDNQKLFRDIFYDNFILQRLNDSSELFGLISKQVLPEDPLLSRLNRAIRSSTGIEDSEVYTTIFHRINQSVFFVQLSEAVEEIRDNLMREQPFRASLEKYRNCAANRVSSRELEQALNSLPDFDAFLDEFTISKKIEEFSRAEKALIFGILCLNETHPRARLDNPDIHADLIMRVENEQNLLYRDLYDLNALFMIDSITRDRRYTNEESQRIALIIYAVSETYKDMSDHQYEKLLPHLEILQRSLEGKQNSEDIDLKSIYKELERVYIDQSRYVYTIMDSMTTKTENFFRTVIEDEGRISVSVGFVEELMDNLKDAYALFDLLRIDSERDLEIVLSNVSKGIDRETDELDMQYVSVHRFTLFHIHQKITDEVRSFITRNFDSETKEFKPLPKTRKMFM